MGVALALSAAPAEGGIIFIDHFTDPATGAPDPNNWHSTGGTNNSGGIMTLPATVNSDIKSVDTWTEGTFEFAIAGAVEGVNCIGIMLNDVADFGLNSIGLRADANPGWCTLQICKERVLVVDLQLYERIPENTVLAIDWSSDLLQVRQDTGSGFTIEYSLDDPAKIPVMSGQIQVFTYGGGELAVDYISVSTIPEPATLVLLAAGGGLMLLRRRLTIN
jgi:hypothetical protein